METSVESELKRLDTVLRELQGHTGLEIYPLNEQMLRRAVELSFEALDLEPFDSSILAAVLVRAEELRAQGENDLTF